MRKPCKLVIIAILLLTLLIFTSCNSNDDIDNVVYKNHAQNVELLAQIVDFTMADTIMVALEQSCAIEETKLLLEQDIIKINDNCYELYIGLLVRFYVENNRIILYTFENTYSEDTRILLYDSLLQKNIKILSTTERNHLIYTQRRTLVNDTIAISPNKGALLHNILGSTKIDLTFINKSNADITYLSICITPYVNETAFDYNTRIYVIDEVLPLASTINKSIITTEWTNYDYYKISKATILFGDGSTIEFDSFDCQFLNDDFSQPSIDDEHINQDQDDNEDESSNNDILDEFSCNHQLNEICICRLCNEEIHTLDSNYHCTVCNQGSITMTGSYAYFGSYPQKIVVDDTIVDTLNQLANVDINHIKQHWTSYNYYQDGSITDCMYFIDIEHAGVLYRGVYIDTYRKKYQQYTNYLEKRVYWFAFEPIKWKIVSRSNGKYMLISEILLDAQEFNYIDGDNNWEYSTIRKWLNNDFYNTAFDNVQKQLISETLLDNKTTGGINRMPQLPPFNAYYDPTNKHAAQQNNTIDKIFLLSRKDIYDSKFGFGNDDKAFQMSASDYSKIQGLYDSNSVNWFLRSPCMVDSKYVALPNNVTGRWSAIEAKGVCGILPVINIVLR